VALGGRGVLAGQWVQHSIAIDATGAPVMQTGHVHGSGWDWCHFDKAEALVVELALILARVVSAEDEDAGAGLEAVAPDVGVEPGVEERCAASVACRRIHARLLTALSPSARVSVGADLGNASQPIRVTDYAIKILDVNIPAGASLHPQVAPSTVPDE
jgi:hypothetical protein